MQTQGYYGSHHTPCIVFYTESQDGGYWYVVEGSVNVNLTSEELPLGVDVETLQDFDMFTARFPIESEDELLEQVKDIEEGHDDEEEE